MLTAGETHDLMALSMIISSSMRFAPVLIVASTARYSWTVRMLLNNHACITHHNQNTSL